MDTMCVVIMHAMCTEVNIRPANGLAWGLCIPSHTTRCAYDRDCVCYKALIGTKYATCRGLRANNLSDKRVGINYFSL